jgi:hypothetical protein
MPERRWNKRKPKGPTLRQHELDVLAFIKARLKLKTRRSPGNRAPKLEEEASPTPPETTEELAATTAEPAATTGSNDQIDS